MVTKTVSKTAECKSLGGSTPSSTAENLCVYVVETGCKYEGGGVDDVFYTFEEALASKPTSFCDLREYADTVKEENRKHNDENFSIWFHHYESDYFSITKVMVKSKAKRSFKACKTCKLTEEEYKILDNGNCFGCENKLEDEMHEALE